MTLLNTNDVPAAVPPVTPRRDVAAAPATYTTGAAAKMCGLSQQTVIRCFDAGRLAGFRVPGSKFRRITRAGLFRFMVDNGIDLGPLGALSDDERAQLAARVAGPVKLTAADRLDAGVLKIA